MEMVAIATIGTILAIATIGTVAVATIRTILAVATIVTVLQGYVFPPRFGFPPHISLGIYVPPHRYH